MNFLPLLIILFLFSEIESASFVDTLGKKYGKVSGCKSEGLLDKTKTDKPSKTNSNFSNKNYISKNK